MIRVAVIDDHPIVVDGLRAAIERTGVAEVVASAGTAAAARDILERDDVDVALIDLRLPDGHGIDLVSIAAARGRPAVIVISSFVSTQYLAAAFQRGAHGFLLKTTTAAQIVIAIQTVAAGGIAFSQEQLREATSAVVALSRRERDIVRLIVRGCSNDEIARHMGLSRKTVEGHLTRIFSRVGAMTRTELALRAEREGWLDFE